MKVDKSFDKIGYLKPQPEVVEELNDAKYKCLNNYNCG